MLFTTVLVIHSLLCVVLIGLVLLQQGKGADAGATFGGSSSSLFGAAGATDFITKLTTTLAIGFMVTSILLIRSYNSGGAGTLTSSSAPKSILEGSIMEPVIDLQPPVEATGSASENDTATPAAAAVATDAEESVTNTAPAVDAEAAATVEGK